MSRPRSGPGARRETGSVLIVDAASIHLPRQKNCPGAGLVGSGVDRVTQKICQFSDGLMTVARAGPVLFLGPPQRLSNCICKVGRTIGRCQPALSEFGNFGD